MSPSDLALFLSLLLLSTCNSAAADWNILKQLRLSPKGISAGISRDNYCQSWRLNVEVNNIRGFDSVPLECSNHVGRYMTSSLQYKSDVQRTTEECTLYLTDDFGLAGDGKDAWVFDVDETLLSTVPFYVDHKFGAEKINVTYLEKWMQEGKATAIEHVKCLYNQIKARGLKIFLISSRKEYLRDTTVDNLIAVGYHGWTGLILRSPRDYHKSIGEFKADERKRLVKDGYRIWAVVSSQWSNLFGDPSPLRIFKLPNPMYYEN